MEMGGAVMDFVQRYQNLQLHRDTSDQLISELLHYCGNTENRLLQDNEDLRRELNDLKLDLSDATKSRRELQQRVKELEAQVGYMAHDNNHLKNRNPYVIILIDGDGLIFKEHFIKNGSQGGKQAAYALRDAVLRECGDFADDIKVVAKAFANVGSLGKWMRLAGLLETEANFKNFTLGFTNAMASFDFVDIGHGKERADFKIQEAIRWNLRNLNCKQIILGIPHDMGYAPFLDEILRDDSNRRRITILEGVPIVKELLATGLHTLDLTSEIFRIDKLVDRTVLNPTPPFASPQAPSVAGMSPLPPPVSTPVSISNSSSTGPAAPISYATVISSASPPPQITFPLQPKPAKPPAAKQEKSTPWNPGARGLDTPLEVNQASLDNIKKRKDNSKLCNNHYLRGPCAKGDSCCFEHKYKPNASEKIAIAFLARLNPCTNGQDCLVEDCIYGHHCPSTINGQCTHPFCKFKPWEHPPGTKFRQTYAWLEE